MDHNAQLICSSTNNLIKLNILNNRILPKQTIISVQIRTRLRPSTLHTHKLHRRSSEDSGI